MDRIWPRIIVREIVTHRSRTALTVLSIAVGLFAVSLTFRTQAILSRNVLDSYAAAVPPTIVVQVASADPAITRTIQRIPGVHAVEGVSHISTRARIGSTWRALALRGLSDMTATQVSRFVADNGAWPAPRRAMLIERSFLANDGLHIGATLPIELENGRQYQLPIAGSVHDVSVISGRLGSPVLQAYVSLDTAEWLTGSRAINELLIALDGEPRDPSQIQAVADRVRAVLKNADYTIVTLTIRDSRVPATYPLLDAVLQTLNVLGGLSLVLSACLVVNTTTAMMARHVPQIGVMKAIGARSAHIFALYVSMVLVIALLAVALALPVAALCSWLLAIQLAWLMNYDIHSVSMPLTVILLELTAGVITPLLASIYPIAFAARVTVRVAVAGAQAGIVGGTNRRSISIPGASLALLYAACSMFRRKARLLLTLAALASGGAIVITVISARSSLAATLDQVSGYWQQDLTVNFSQPERVARVVGEAMQVPGVAFVEQQPAVLAVRRATNTTESVDRYAIYGVNPTSGLLRPTLVQGRWLAPDDRDAIVVNVDLLKREPGLALGDRLRLANDGRTTAWQIVGVVTTSLFIYGEPTLGQGAGYVNAAAFMQTIFQAQQTNRMIISTTQHDAAFRAHVSRALEARFAQFGIQALVQTEDETRGRISSLIDLIVILLLVMALSFVAVGALSLVGAMSLNVMERIKEIGVLRAIGASHARITHIVVLEGTCIGLLSWIPATLLAIPLSTLLSDVLGWSVMSWPLVYVFPPFAPLVWMATVVVLSASASYVPARRAARINVRDALEYE